MSLRKFKDGRHGSDFSNSESPCCLTKNFSSIELTVQEEMSNMCYSALKFDGCILWFNMLNRIIPMGGITFTSCHNFNYDISLLEFIYHGVLARNSS